MNSYRDTITYLYGLQGKGMKFGLRNTRALLRSMGNPHRDFPSIHIAGTNGKGSTAAFLASVFTEAGYRTGLYTSPHLVRFTERIRINGKEIDERRLVSYTREIREQIDDLNATFFEATTCMAFRYFADEGVDIAVVETGLGGRLDSTNVITPLACVITNVSFDHMEYLGNTLKKIAREKGGIIKSEIPCITASEDPVVMSVLKQSARTKRTKLFEVKKAVSLNVHIRSKVSFTSKHFRLRNVKLGLRGSHQHLNAATALAALEVLSAKGILRKRFSRITGRVIRRAFARIHENTGLRGRFETVEKRYLVDVAHNPEGIRTLLSRLPRHLSNLTTVFGVMADKDYRQMSEMVARHSQSVVLVQPKVGRALDRHILVTVFRELGSRYFSAPSVRAGVAVANRLAGRDGKILVTGSHYVVGEALQALERRQRVA